MVDKINIELDSQFLKKFFSLTDKMIPDGQEITPLMLKKQLDEIAENMEETKLELKQAQKQIKDTPAKVSQPIPSAPSFADSPSFDDDGFNLPKKNILIIDDLGVITYQLSVLFQQFNYEVVTSKEIYDAIEKFKKQNFDVVIMDLFIPTEREGFILLEELKKISLSKPKSPKIGVMSASSKKEHKQMCKMKGAEFYVEKIDDWQKELYTITKSLR
jgi:CheY-like chemotaxis protein